MADDDLPPSKHDDIDADEESISGQTGRLFGALVVVGLLIALGAFFGLGGIHAIQWLWTQTSH